MAPLTPEPRPSHRRPTARLVLPTSPSPSAADRPPSLRSGRHHRLHPIDPPQTPPWKSRSHSDLAGLYAQDASKHAAVHSGTSRGPGRDGAPRKRAAPVFSSVPRTEERQQLEGEVAAAGEEATAAKDGKQRARFLNALGLNIVLPASPTAPGRSPQSARLPSPDASSSLDYLAAHPSPSPSSPSSSGLRPVRTFRRLSSQFLGTVTATSTTTTTSEQHARKPSSVPRRAIGRLVGKVTLPASPKERQPESTAEAPLPPDSSPTSPKSSERSRLHQDNSPPIHQVALPSTSHHLARSHAWGPPYDPQRRHWRSASFVPLFDGQRRPALPPSRRSDDTELPTISRAAAFAQAARMAPSTDSVSSLAVDAAGGPSQASSGHATNVYAVSSGESTDADVRGRVDAEAHSVSLLPPASLRPPATVPRMATAEEANARQPLAIDLLLMMGEQGSVKEHLWHPDSRSNSTPTAEAGTTQRRPYGGNMDKARNLLGLSGVDGIQALGSPRQDDWRKSKGSVISISPSLGLLPGAGASVSPSRAEPSDASGRADPLSNAHDKISVPSRPASHRRPPHMRTASAPAVPPAMSSSSIVQDHVPNQSGTRDRPAFDGQEASGARRLSGATHESLNRSEGSASRQPAGPLLPPVPLPPQPPSFYAPHEAQSSTSLYNTSYIDSLPPSPPLLAPSRNARGAAHHRHLRHSSSSSSLIPSPHQYRRDSFGSITGCTVSPDTSVSMLSPERSTFFQKDRREYEEAVDVKARGSEDTSRRPQEASKLEARRAWTAPLQRREEATDPHGSSAASDPRLANAQESGRSMKRPLTPFSPSHLKYAEEQVRRRRREYGEGGHGHLDARYDVATFQPHHTRPVPLLIPPPRPLKSRARLTLAASAPTTPRRSGFERVERHVRRSSSSSAGLVALIGVATRVAVSRPSPARLLDWATITSPTRTAHRNADGGESDAVPNTNGNINIRKVERRLSEEQFPRGMDSTSGSDEQTVKAGAPRTPKRSRAGGTYGVDPTCLSAYSDEADEIPCSDESSSVENRASSEPSVASTKEPLLQHGLDADLVRELEKATRELVHLVAASEEGRSQGRARSSRAKNRMANRRSEPRRLLPPFMSPVAAGKRRSESTFPRLVDSAPVSPGAAPSDYSRDQPTPLALTLATAGRSPGGRSARAVGLLGIDSVMANAFGGGARTPRNAGRAFPARSRSFTTTAHRGLGDVVSPSWRAECVIKRHSGAGSSLSFDCFPPSPTHRSRVGAGMPYVLSSPLTYLAEGVREPSKARSVVDTIDVETSTLIRSQGGTSPGLASIGRRTASSPGDYVRWGNGCRQAEPPFDPTVEEADRGAYLVGLDMEMVTPTRSPRHLQVPPLPLSAPPRLTTFAACARENGTEHSRPHAKAATTTAVRTRARSKSRPKSADGATAPSPRQGEDLGCAGAGLGRSATVPLRQPEKESAREHARAVERTLRSRRHGHRG